MYIMPQLVYDFTAQGDICVCGLKKNMKETVTT